MVCKRGHSIWHQTNFVIDGKLKKRCDYIMGYKLRGDSLTKVIFCGELPLGESLPPTYISLTELSI